MCAHSWKWQSKYPMGYRTLPQASGGSSVSHPAAASTTTTTTASANHLPREDEAYLKVNVKGLIINHFKPEVNNNDAENVGVYQ